MQLDDLNFADDLALPSHTQLQMSEKAISVPAAASVLVGINIHKGKSTILLYKSTYNNRITHDGEAMEDVKLFTYLGSITDEHDGSDADVNVQICKARAVYL
ncbi:unnamed protein product [Schistosoma curassoni]|uniref:PITH domain-containing protein n=1 Tax=Schistosoma curassoni TaxID=6186 RepID=A0A183JYS5_9TREM|nr:unnamed protein product [Schistosoma curassoni]